MIIGDTKTASQPK